MKDICKYGNEIFLALLFLVYYILGLYFSLDIPEELKDNECILDIKVFVLVSINTQIAIFIFLALIKSILYIFNSNKGLEERMRENGQENNIQLKMWIGKFRFIVIFLSAIGIVIIGPILFLQEVCIDLDNSHLKRFAIAVVNLSAISVYCTFVSLIAGCASKRQD